MKCSVENCLYFSPTHNNIRNNIVKMYVTRRINFKKQSY